MERLPSVIDRILDGMDMPIRESQWAYSDHPRTNVMKTDDGLEIRMLTPGRKKEDMKLKVNGRILSVSASKAESEEEKGRNFVRREFSHHEFERSFKLSDELDVDSIVAEYKDGVLSIFIPNDKNRVKNKEIAIK